jgi:hypothetical protein
MVDTEGKTHATSSSFSLTRKYLISLGMFSLMFTVVSVSAVTHGESEKEVSPLAWPVERLYGHATRP